MASQEEAESNSENSGKVVKKKPVKSTGYVKCPVCGEVVKSQGRYAHFSNSHADKDYEEYKDKFEVAPIPMEDMEEEAEEEPLLPTEVEMTDVVKEKLRAYLPTVYGIPKKQGSKRIAAILDTLSPAAATNPWNLHNHIKNFAPQADDRHLQSIINKIFAELESEGYGADRPVAYQTRYGRGYPSYPARFPQDPMYPADPYYQGPPGYGGYPKEPPFMGGYPPREPKEKKKNMTIVVDGQEIQTDMQGYMAWKRWKAEKKKDEREEKEHEMRMKKFDAEIRKLSTPQAQPKNETLVEVPVGDSTIKVPANIAPLYIRKGDSPELKEIRSRLKEATEEVSKLRDEKHEKEIKDIKGQLAAVYRKLEEKPGFWEQARELDKWAEMRGLKPVGKGTIDVISDVTTNIDKRAQQLMNRMTPGQGEFKADVKRTPQERKEKAKKIRRKLEKKEGVLRAEDDFVQAASRMKL